MKRASLDPEPKHPPSREVTLFRLAIRGIAVICGVLACCPSLASTVVVPDDVSTVQLAIDSGADTVAIREGSYPERPIVDHAIVMQGIGITQRPRLAGLDIVNANFSALPPLLSVTGIDFSGRVNHTTVSYHPRLLQLSFSDCALESGFYQVLSTDPDDVALLSMRDCRLGGRSSARAYQVTMVADTIAGDVAWALHEASILNNWFQGGAIGITLTDTPRGAVAHNRIENYDVGIDIRNAELVVEYNTLRHCQIGMKLSGEWAEVRNNNIGEVESGIYATAYDVRVRNNTIVGALGHGVRGEDVVYFVAEGNVIGQCGGSGVSAEWWESGHTVSVRGNTLFGNGGSGVELIQPLGLPVVERNIGYKNREWGLKATAGAAIDLVCNDWFSNGLGAVMGVADGSTDLGVDPLFCNADSADVRLDSLSPVLDVGGCGQIGALGVGCGVTATVVQRFTAGRESEGIRVVWEVADGATASEIWLERSEARSGQVWIRPRTERLMDSRAMVELDRSALSDRRYWYRLVALEGNSATVIGSPIGVGAQARLDSRLVGVSPNPGGGPVRIAFALDHAGAIEVGVYDLQGRKIASPGRGVWPAGSHEVVWDGRTRNGQSAPAGMYVVRYLYPGGKDRRGIVRIR